MGGSMYGNQDHFVLLSKTDKNTTMAMEIRDIGCVLKNTRHKNSEIEDSLLLIADVLIADDIYGGKSFAKAISSGGEKTDFTFTDVVDAVVDTASTSNKLIHAWMRETQVGTFTQTTETDDGSYSINGADFVLITDQATVTLAYGDTVEVKLTSDTSASTAANVTLTMADTTSATYDVTTAA